ncbi:MAG: hypothetical protein CVV53_03335 [Spirochaetae bacterium HGW-Spirochaetae-9]|nr:MAG: hypothetical protein CVV53_03335 [Spirochaetae bacterium HGW-Spirochaetae-9]
MARKMRIVLLSAAMTVLMLSLAACAGSPAPEAKSKAGPAAYVPETKVKKAYQVLNDGMYVLEGVVRTEDGQLADCDIEEMNTMLVWGNFASNKITKDEMAKLGEDNTFTALFKGHGTAVPTQFAKYVQVGDVVFTAGADANGQIIYTSEKTGEVVSHFAKSEENIAWFFMEMRFGNYWLLKKVDKSYEKFEIAAFFQDMPGATLEKNKSQNKKYCKHWDNWVPNIYKIETFFKTNGFIPGNFRQGADGQWAVADVITGATITEFDGYAGILYKANSK